MSRYFVGVGTQKAGTTWLHDQLMTHPQVALPDRKEVHYFDSAYRQRDGKSFAMRYVRTIRSSVKSGNTAQALRLIERLEMAHAHPRHYLDYLESFADAETLAVGEITPAYAMLTREGFVAMRQVLKRPQVIFTLRDPIDRYWSALRMAVDEADAVRVFQEHPVVKSDAGRGDYRTIVTMLDEVFGDRVLYLFFESMFTEDALRATARHLGVAEEWGWDLGKKSNVGTSVPMPDVRPEMADHLRTQYDFCRERFGDAVPDRWRL